MESDFKHVLDCLPASSCNRQDWVTVGMALKEEGEPFELWDSWSATDSRPKQYQGTEYCQKIWDSFQGGSGSRVFGGTIVEMARARGYDPYPKIMDTPFDWEDLITDDGERCFISETKPMTVPVFKSSKREPFQIIEYLETCFRPDDHIDVITSSFRDGDGKLKPFGMGVIALSVDDYIAEIRKNADDPEWFEMTFGSYDHDAGVWLRVNPIRGTLNDGQKGIGDRDVTRFENALIECDDLPIDEQVRLIRELKLPYKALVYSGGKSIHAIIRIDAASRADYQERITWLQNYCIANGLPVDTQNKNPSRLSRLPGCTRGNQKQILIETAKPDPFEEFRKAAEAEEEGQKLEIVSFASVCKDLPEKSPEVIEGVLRKGHKMLISGPSKAGKSFALIYLMIAVAEGKKWMGHQCRKGRVLYLNLEIDERSFFWRVNDVYDGHEWSIENADSIDIMNLRGRAEPLSTLAPKLEARLRRNHYDLVIFDPIYKIITGDENSAGDMGAFCNLFDRIARAGDCAVAYCHHHSKGSQAQKSAIDRASGSGVFARDPDAIVDMTELYVADVDRAEIKARQLEAVTDTLLKSTGQWKNLMEYHPGWLNDRIQKQELAEKHFELFPDRRKEFETAANEAEELGDCDAYRISMTLREFKSPPDANVFFKYPIHVKDPTGVLEGAELAGDKKSLETMNKIKKDRVKKRSDAKRKWFDEQTEAGKEVTISAMAEHFGNAVNTIKGWVDRQEDLTRQDGIIVQTPEKQGVNLGVNQN